MERLDIDAAAVFECLAQDFQRENTELRDLARRIVGVPEKGPTR